MLIRRLNHDACPSSRKIRLLGQAPSRQDLVFPSGKGTVANQANIMNRHFRLMQIEAGVFTEIIEIKPIGKEATKKKAKYGLNALRHFCGNHTN